MPRWPSPDPNSWANPRGRKKGKGTTSKARQLRKATSPRVLAKTPKKAKEEAAAAAAASSAQPLQQGGQAATQAEPLQQGEKAATQTEPLQQGEKPATGAEPLQEGKKAEKAATQAEPLQQGDKAATQAEPLQQGDKAATQAQPLQQGEKAEKAATKPEPLQQGEKEEEKEEVWETALGKRARPLQKRKAKQWQVKEAPLPEGKPLQQGEAKAKSRPASSEKGKRKTDVSYVSIGSDSGSSTQPSLSRSSSTRGSRQPLKQGTPATPKEAGGEEKGFAMQKNPRVWEYCDTEDEEKIRKASKIKSLKQGQEYEPDENDDEEFGNMWKSNGHSQMQRMCDDAKGSGKGAAKEGGSKALKEGPGKGRKRGELALKDKEEEKEEEKEPNPEDEMKEALKKAKRARDLTQSQSTDLEDALVKASSLLTKEGKRKGLEQQQELQKLLQQLKAVCSKENMPLTKLKELLVEVTRAQKDSKDTIKELKHLANRAPSRGSFQGSFERFQKMNKGPLQEGIHC
eukprot:symbB.v1.2.014552.t1/scaffold1051.1/size143026/2